MKKFYSLALAAAVAAGSLSASALEKAPRTVELNANPALTLKVEAPAFTKAETTSVSSRADRNMAGDYFISCDMRTQSGTIELFDPMPITAGTEANSYVIDQLIYSDANPINAKYETVDVNGQTLELLVIPAGQVWFTVNGRDCLLVAACSNASGWGADETGDLEFLIEEIDGDVILSPAWSFGSGYTSCIGWVYKDETNRGSYFANTEFYMANGVFTGQNVTGQDETTGDLQFTAVTAPIYASGFKQAGKNNLEISGIATTRYTMDPLTLVIADNGDATATNVVAGNYYTDNTQTTTVPAYYWNGEVSDADAVVTATFTEADGKSTITFASDVLFAAMKENGKWSWVAAWSEPKIVINHTFGYVAGVENIAADVEDLNAPVEYYNLQGIRVAQPEAGQLLIQRQGNKATKVVIR